MAKVNSIVMLGTQGTLQDLTFVNSKRYKHHVRNRRGTIKPAVLNDVLKLSGKQLQKAVPAAKLVLAAIPKENRDGTFWNRLLSIFRKALKTGKWPDANAFAGLECNIDHKLDTLLYNTQYTVSVRSSAKSLDVTITLSRHPYWKKAKKVDSYLPSLVAIFPDYAKSTTDWELVQHPPVSLKSAAPVLVFTIPKPAKAKMPLLFFGLLGCYKNRPPDPSLPQLAGMRGVGDWQHK